MAFEGLTEKLSAAFKKLRGKGRLSFMASFTSASERRDRKSVV